MADLEKRLDQAVKAGERKDAIERLLAKCDKRREALSRIRSIVTGVRIVAGDRSDLNTVSLCDDVLALVEEGLAGS